MNFILSPGDLFWVETVCKGYQLSCRLLFKIPFFFFKTVFQGPDQVIGFDLVPSCLQRLSAVIIQQ